MKLSVKFGGRSIAVEIESSSTVKDLKFILQPLTNVLPRGQKLIFKGKVLSDELTLVSLGVIDGSKIMLMASQGLHQGGGPVKKEVAATSSVTRVADVRKGNTEELITKTQLQRWRATGVIAVASCGFTKIPEEILSCGPTIRVLDISRNSLHEVQAAIGQLSSIQKLLLGENSLLDTSISWEGITSLKSITTLSLDQNNLTELPPALGCLTSLKNLHVASNKLIHLPAEIGLLSELHILKAQNNRITIVPYSIGGCVSLTEVDLSCNLLTELPQTCGDLKRLKALHLHNNGLKSLPKTIFKKCLQLSTLDLHNTEITMDILRQFEGWESFDERRRLKHQKKLDFRVSGSAEFDEGADKNWKSPCLNDWSWICLRVMNFEDHLGQRFADHIVNLYTKKDSSSTP